MRLLSLFLLITILCLIYFSVYWRVLTDWMQNIRVDVNTQSRIGTILKTVAFGVYAFLAVQFMKKKTML
jgi:hypothetical protein